MTTPGLALAMLLSGAVLFGSWRLLTARGIAPAQRLLRLLLQPLLALLLYLTLLPPEREATPAPLLTVLTADWQHSAADTLDPATTIALPEAGDAAPGATAVDLASALRRHPSSRLRIVGSGLERRDLDAARGRVLAFLPATSPGGFVELQLPPRLLPGQQFSIRGRGHAAPGATASLLDPLGQALARAALADGGTFMLQQVARGSGPALLTLQLSDAAGAVIDALPLALPVGFPDRPRLLLLSGAPGVELKYLRRWALDAGVELSARTLLSPGQPQRRGRPALDAAALQQFDLAILDDRAWHELRADEREMLLQAVRDGLGLLLRLTADPHVGEHSGLQQFGFTISPADIGRSVHLAAPGAAQPATALQRRPLAVAAADAVPLLESADGEPLALWRALGRGRVALWWLGDSYRLQLAGAAAQHGTLWSEAVAALARPRGERQLRIEPGPIWVDQRVTLCDLGTDAVATAPDGGVTVLLGDRRGGCTGYWPAAAGLHRIDRADGSSHWLHVHTADAAPALRAHARQRTTERLLAERLTARIPATPARPMEPWPFFGAWLLLFGLLGWLERRPADRG
jgi:hypothetical protein